MSANDFDQTTSLPVGDDETQPLPSFTDAPPASEHTFEPQNTPIVPPAHVWSAEDVKEAPYRGVRIGQLLWACIIIFTAIALIAMAFLKAANLALVAIVTLAVMGVLLIIIAGVSTVMTRKKRQLQ